MKNSQRIEQDFLGEKAVPAQAYWGVHTARALDNFAISGRAVADMPEMVRALAAVKKACAQANLKFGVLDSAKTTAIAQACDDLMAGKFVEQFVVDVIQGGAGTSTNMNANEVIANIGLEKMGHSKGEYQYLHPNDHINASQSTNDVYPTALRLALWYVSEELLTAAQDLQTAFTAKAKEFDSILKIGRTQLQDAVPMTLGQEFSTFAAMIGNAAQNLRQTRTVLEEINLGGTAIGTGINAPAGFAEEASQLLAQIAGVPVRKSANMIAATQDTGAFVLFSAAIKHLAVYLSKISNDLRLLSSGPQAGLGDILLPAKQAGSSIMPGKVNPVIPEVVSQVSFAVIGNDMTISMAAEAGQLQLNAFEPVIGWSLYQNVKQLAHACITLRTNCVEGIQANQRLLKERVKDSITLVTALNPLIGYENAAIIAKKSMATGLPIDQVAEDAGIMSKEELNSLLVPEKLTQPCVLKR